jgi:hypothetical protein
MPMAMQHEHDNVYRLDIGGLAMKKDFVRFEDALVQEIRRIGPVRLLFVLTAFEGWEPHEDWSDLSFYIKHGDSIERIAIVADEKWRHETMMFAAADLRKAPVEFFPSSDIDRARDWLSA